MPKPTADARWAETVAGVPAANIVEPNEGQKDTGYADNQAPTAGYFNHWMNAVWRWVKWARDYAAGLDLVQTWTAKQTFNAGLATPTAPAAGDDVANRTYVDGQIATRATPAYVDGGDAALDARLDVLEAAPIWQNCPVENNWTLHGTNPLKVWKDSIGRLHFRGAIVAGALPSPGAFHMPAGLLISQSALFACVYQDASGQPYKVGLIALASNGYAAVEIPKPVAEGNIVSISATVLVG